MNICRLSMLQLGYKLGTPYFFRAGFSTAIKKSPQNIPYGRSYTCLPRSLLSFTPKKLPNVQQSQRFKQTYDINTNVAKDVILFKYENAKFYKILNAFSICQFMFWVYLSHFAYTTLKDVPVPRSADLPWYRRINLGDNKYRNGIAIFSFGVGYLILVSSWLFTLRSVRFLILRKGGRSLTFVTYGPFGKNRMTTIPLHEVSCKEARQNARVQLPIKVNNYWLHFILDMRGEFTNPKLFDQTAGLRRVFAPKS